MARLLLYMLPLFLLACKTGGPLLSKKTPHEQYSRKLREAGLHETVLGRSWLAAGDRALTQPLPVPLPYRENGYLPPEEPRAIGLQFTAKRGQRLRFEISKNPSAGFQLYTELWRPGNNGGQPELLQALDTNAGSFTYDVDRDLTLILRLQPELLAGGEYTMNISVGPSLGFPVAGKSARVGSVWGDDRDAGARKHEGIDIFAPKRTPAIAAEDGVITLVREGGLGGKVVFMRPKGKNVNLYYAHLDEQLVQESQRVSKGDTIGLVGNTGNAQTTPPHLHFGIYAGGAIDPLPFVDPAVRQAPALTLDRGLLKLTMRLRTAYTAKSTDGSAATTYAENTLLQPRSLAAGYITGQLPDGRLVILPQSNVVTNSNELRSVRLKTATALLAQPIDGAPKKGLLQKEARLSVLGYFNRFARVRSESGEGWVPVNVLS